MVFKNYYKILDLETSRVSIEQIKNAYRIAAKKYHPDVNIGDELSEEKIKDINEAYRVLSVPSSKRKYDRVWNSKFGKAKKAFIGEDRNNAIKNIFLGNTERENTNDEKVRDLKPIKGESIETSINATIHEAFFGLDKKIQLRSVDGKNKNFIITIPKGIKNGEKLRLIGQGKEGKNGGKNGDLFIKINIEDEKNFKLEGTNIYTQLLLTPWEAALGTRANVESIDDTTKVYIPQGIQSGEKIRIPGKGYQNSDGTRGDLIAEVKIVVQKQLTKQEEEIYKKLNEISKFNPRNENI